MKYRAVIFDLDGTLIDTLEDLSHAMNTALNQVGRPSRTVEECRQMIGNGVQTFALRALGDNYRHLLDRTVMLMREEYQRNLYTYSRIYDGIPDTIRILSEHAIGMGITTNKNSCEAERIVRHFFGSMFPIVVGVDEITPVKPDPSGTHRVINEMNSTPAETLFVGDSEVDIETACKAGVRFIGAGWGFRGREGLFAAGAEDIIDHPHELLAFVA